MLAIPCTGTERSIKSKQGISDENHYCHQNPKNLNPPVSDNTILKTTKTIIISIRTLKVKTTHGHLYVALENKHFNVKKTCYNELLVYSYIATIVYPRPATAIHSAHNWRSSKCNTQHVHGIWFWGFGGCVFHVVAIPWQAWNTTPLWHTLLTTCSSHTLLPFNTPYMITKNPLKPVFHLPVKNYISYNY